MTIKKFIENLTQRRREIGRRLDEIVHIEHQGDMTPPLRTERTKLNKELKAILAALERATRERTDGL